MKLKPVKLAPALIAVGVILLVGVGRLLSPVEMAEAPRGGAPKRSFDFFERLERMTYDMRVRLASHFPAPASTNIGLVFISDDTIDRISKGLLGVPYGLYWPRQIYGRLVRELANQHAITVAFDVIFAEPRLDHGPVYVSTARFPDAVEFAASLRTGGEPVIFNDDEGERMLAMDSDEYFAWQLKRSGIAILAADQGVQPLALFATNASGVADISAERDADGVLRRVKAFRLYRKWHPAFLQVENDPAFGVDLRRAYLEEGHIVLPRADLEPIRIPIDEGNNFDLADFGGEQLPPGMPRRDKAFIEERIWHMGIVLAARALHLDLAGAQVDLGRGRILFPGSGGSQRILPVDRKGYFYINWEFRYTDPRITKEPMENLLIQDKLRLADQTNGLASHWENKLAIVGSRTVGNDLTDRGATPLERDTLLVSKHWNVANSILTGRFVERSSVGVDLMLIALMGIVAALLTWQLPALRSFVAVIVLLAGYGAAAAAAYVKHRYWLPVVFPLGGGLLMQYFCLMTWRVVFENAERRRVKSIFSRIVSPNIVNELLDAEQLSLVGARREVTVLFADIRGFTEFTDRSQEQVAAFVAEQKLSGEEAEACFNANARETLNTVNTYLALVADMVKKHDGTLDKYIGDCVMAFWGAPTPNAFHARDCVRAAIEAQRAIYELNRRRSAENKERETENLARVSAGLMPKPMLPILLLGTGINTGIATVGLMGSEAHISNYTIFGREVNLASRLEGLSGRGRVLIAETTYQRLLRDDPALAATCIALPDANVKGIRSAVKVYEVPWQPPGAEPIEQPSSKPTDTSFTTPPGF